MKIALFAPFNPLTVFDSLTEESKAKVMNINQSATSVNTLIKSLLLLNHSLVVITQNNEIKENVVLSGKNIEIHIIGVRFTYRILTLFPILPYNAQLIYKQIVNSLTSVDVIHVHWTYEFALAGLKFAKLKPIICSVRDWAPAIYENIPFHPFYLYFVKKLFWIQKIIIQKMVIKNRDISFVSNSLYTKEKIEHLNPLTKAELIFNSINKEDIVLEKLKIPHNYTFISICVSVDDPHKNIDTLIKAFTLFCQKYPDSKLIIVGKIHYDRKLFKKWKSEKMLNNVEFTGILERTEVFKMLDNSTCMVHPSLEETFGNVLLEAMARCVPIIGGINSGAVPHVLKYGACGCLCDIKSHIDVCNSMLQIVENNDYTNTIVKTATNILFSEYSSEVVAKKHIELYNKLLN